MKQITARALRWGIAGMLIGPATVYSLMLFVLYTDERCAPGGVGICHLDIGINLVLGVIAGFVLFFGVTFVRGLRRRARADNDQSNPPTSVA